MSLGNRALSLLEQHQCWISCAIKVGTVGGAFAGVGIKAASIGAVGLDAVGVGAVGGLRRCWGEHLLMSALNLLALELLIWALLVLERSVLLDFVAAGAAGVIGEAGLVVDGAPSVLDQLCHQFWNSGGEHLLVSASKLLAL